MRINWQSKHANIIKNLYRLFTGRFRASKTVTKLIFKMKPHPKNRRTHWDLTTLVLKKALNKYVKDNQRILEMGTGDLAILSIFIAKRKKNVDITAVDVNPYFVKNAKINAEKNNVKLNLFRSDLFSNVNGSFDVVFFNAPYMPSDWGLKYEVTKWDKMKMESVYNRAWDGGKYGCDIVNRFLNDASKMISPKGKIMLGVNTFFIDDSRMKEMIKENNLELIAIVSSKFNPSKAYVVRDESGTKRGDGDGYN